jgi:Flp pilus assembly protein TadG
MIKFPFKGDDGSTIVEFAVVAPLFVLVLFAALQISLVLLIQNAMDTAAREASRVGITGATESGMTRSQAINAKISTGHADMYSGGIVDPSKVSIVVKAYS